MEHVKIVPVPHPAVQARGHTRGEDRFQTLAKVAPIGIFEADATGCCTFMNPLWETICQQPAEHALGFGWLEVVHPDDRDWLAEPRSPSPESDQPLEERFRIVRPSGEVRSLRVRLGSVRSPEGVHIGWSGTFEDITEALRDAEALRRATRQQEAVAALGLLALGSPDGRALLDEAVARTAEALGAARVEIVGVGDQARPDDPPAIRAAIDDPRRQSAAIVAVPREGCDFGARDLSFLQAIANVLSAFVQREQLDARARKRERWLRAYFERSPDVVLRLDARALILEANPAAERLLGASRTSLRGQSSQRLGLSEPAFATWRIAVDQAYRSQQYQSLDVHLETSRGPRTYVAQLSAVADEAGSVEFVGAILRDVTDRARVEDELRALHRELLDRDDRLQALVGSLLGERSVLRDRARAWGIAALTARERTILRLLANGRTNREIALKLGLSPGTVKNRIGLLLPKLGAADRTQAVAIALQLGLLDGLADHGAAATEPRPLPHFNLGDFE